MGRPGRGGNINSLTESLINNLNKPDPAFFKNGKGEDGSEAKGDEKCCVLLEPP
jgi:hypothetical protein